MASFGTKDLEDLLKQIDATLNQINTYYGGGGAGISTLGEQPDGDFVKQKATGVVDSFQGSLNVGESYESEWFDTDGYGSVQIFVSADVPSEPRGLEIEYTDDVQASTPTVQASKEFGYSTEAVDRGFEDYSVEPILDGFRFRYTNNGLQATDISLFATLRTGLALDGADYVDQNTLGDRFVRVGTSAERNFCVWHTVF